MESTRRKAGAATGRGVGDDGDAGRGDQGALRT